MELQRYDIIEAEIKGKGNIQCRKRPYIVVSNTKAVAHSNIITVMPLTSVIKKKHLPVHGCLEAEDDNGLSVYSMVLGEQPQTISKEEVIRKFGTVTNKKQRDIVNKVCYNSFFFGEDIKWEEVLA